LESWLVDNDLFLLPSRLAGFASLKCVKEKDTKQIYTTKNSYFYINYSQLLYVY